MRLISFPTCPFVHRATIILVEKGHSVETVYIDLDDPPEWFASLSPRGRVPVLEVDGVGLFESQAICEFLEETMPDPPLMPSHPIERARDRAWFAFFGEDVFFPLYFYMNATTPERTKECLDALMEALERLEEALGDARWLSGDGSRFGMADVAGAPAALRFMLLAEHGRWTWPVHIPHVRAWMERAAARESVKASVPSDFETLFLEE